MAGYLVDTNVLIQAIRRKQGRWEFLRRLVEARGTLAVSVITVGELYAGMRPHEVERTEELLSGFDHYPVTVDLARHAGLLKNQWAAKGFCLTLANMIIAATAISRQLLLLTENRKDFPMPELHSIDLPEGP